MKNSSSGDSSVLEQAMRTVPLGFPSFKQLKGNQDTHHVCLPFLFFLSSDSYSPTCTYSTFRLRQSKHDPITVTNSFIFTFILWYHLS